MKGKVKMFNAARGFGFITGDDGKDVYVHTTAIEGGAELSVGDGVEYDVDAREKYLSDRSAAPLLEKLKGKLEGAAQFSRETIERSFKELAEEAGVKLGVIIHPARAALTGKTESPGIYDVVEILGMRETVKRLEDAISYLGK